MYVSKGIYGPTILRTTIRTSYDRYYEGRKTFGSLTSNVSLEN